MDEFIVKSVERVIRVMQENLGEPLTIDDMARTALFSKFHFSRMFQRVTGIPPGRFLSALRLAEAKRLLLTSSLSVADISHLVGYNSIGTFSSRFRMSVGVSPTGYRQFGGWVPPLEEQLTSTWTGRGERSAIHGTVHQQARCGHVVLGVFPDRIAQGIPVRHATLTQAGEFTLFDVPDGTWHVIAHTVVEDTVPDVVPDVVNGGEEVHLAVLGPIQVSAGKPVRTVDMWLRPRRIFDPPALLAQLDPSMLAAKTRVPGGVDEAALPGA